MVGTFVSTIIFITLSRAGIYFEFEEAHWTWVDETTSGLKICCTAVSVGTQNVPWLIFVMSKLA